MSASLSPKKQATTMEEEKEVIQEKHKQNQLTTDDIHHHHNYNKDNNSKSKSVAWDCGSSLYDSFELKSFERHLDSAITASRRTLSMPHYSDHRGAHPPPPPPPPPPSKKSSRFSRRSLLKLLRSIFGPKQQKVSGREGIFLLYDGSRALSTIPEVSEMGGDYGGGLSPEISSAAVRRTASDRFTAASVGISCA